MAAENNLLKFYRAEAADSLSIPAGTTVELESLRQAVVPPYLMLMPFIEVPDSIVVEERRPLGEDGVHGCIYHLEAKVPGEGEIVIGFRDLRTKEITHRKVIPVSVT